MTYDFRCPKCGHEDEVNVPVAECNDNKDCPSCGQHTFVRIPICYAPMVKFNCEGFPDVDAGGGRFIPPSRTKPNTNKKI